MTPTRSNVVSKTTTATTSASATSNTGSGGGAGPLDCNGRVARLMSHAMLLETLETRGGLVGFARGIARDAQTHENHLAYCDQTRWNDRDARVTLSQEALVDFKFFIATCIYEITFMESLTQPECLDARILLWAGEEVKLGEPPCCRRFTSWQPSQTSSRASK